MIVTKHPKQGMKEWSGLKKSADRIAAVVYVKGLNHGRKDFL